MQNYFLRLKNAAKRIFERIGNERLRLNMLQAIPFWMASLITGLIAVFYAKSFALAEKLTTVVYNYHAGLLFVLLPASFIVSWWLVKKYAPYSKGSGIPQVMAAVELATPKHNEKISKLLSLRIIIIKILSSLIMVFGGGAIGREGPTIQIAGSVFRKTYSLLPEWWPKISKKNMIMTGAAAGLAAAFNTPLGGIVFAVEELTKMHISYFKAAIFTAVIIAGLTVQSLLGPYLYIGFPTINELSNMILLGVILVAVIGGLLGGATARIMWLLLKWKAKIRSNSYTVAYLLLSSLILATLAYYVNQNVLGSGRSLLTASLFSQDKYSHWYMPLLRIAGPILSFTTGSAGGIFAPGLSAGGSIGSVISGWFQLSASDTNLMILSGMVAFLTGITRAPFTAAILVLEMTDRNNLILHLMLAGIVASFVAVLVDKHSIYEYLKRQYMHEILLEENRDKNSGTEESNLPL
jgi:H+/Cl- antiporter ClcA